MELSQFFKSVIDMDTSAVVICDTAHKIVYMNPAAVASYEKYGGASLLGKSLLACHNPRSREAIEKVLAWFGASTENNIVHTYYNEKENKDVYMVALHAENGALIGYYEKHEYRTRDTAPLYAMD
ncbi:MAG: PAS domain-containing protein [Clostridia bacterium]|nr:PAS domain-containing protein [Clostridia bacterium]